MATNAFHHENIRNEYSSKWNLLFDKWIKEWISFKPKVGLEVYPCYACRHMFGSKNSFLDHVNRRSIKIKYNCRQCTLRPEDRTFYNPCSFLLHARKHFNLNNGIVDLEDVDVHELPVGLAGFMPHPDIKMLYDVEDNDSFPGFINNRFYNPTGESYGHRIVYFIPNEVFLFTGTQTERTSTLALKQTCLNIPKCVLIPLENSNRNPNTNTNVAIPCTINLNLPPLVNASSVVKEVEANNNKNYNYECTMPVITKVETIIESNDSDDSDTDDSVSEKCPECKVVCKESLDSHFIEHKRPLDEQFTCTACKFIAPTPCAFKAHKRVHVHRAPFVCPDCGILYQIWSDLLIHMESVCFHTAKTVRVKCPIKKCGRVFALNANFATHLIILHMQRVYLCTTCNDTFKTEEEYALHEKASHPSSEQEDKSTVGSEKGSPCAWSCDLCNDEKTISKCTREQHAVIHVNDRNNLVYIYVCKYCKNAFRTTTTYSMHLSRCSKNTDQTGPATAAAATANVAANATVTATAAVANAASGNGKEEKKQEQQAKKQEEKKGQTVGTTVIITICSKCNTRLRCQIDNAKDFLSKCPRCEEKLYFPARIGGEKSKVKSTGIENAPRQDKEKTTDNINLLLDNNNCLLCKSHVENPNEHSKICKFYSAKVLVEKVAVTTTKSSPPKEEPTEGGDGVAKTQKKRKKYNYESLTNKHKRLLQNENYPELLTNNDVIEPITFEGVYNCRVCNFSNEDRTLFKSHILEHRLISTSYQCMECGECFVVKPSLGKHLQFYHQIVDVENYLKENDCYDKDAVKKLEKTMEGEPLKENQCKVCLEQFNSDFDLNKHFRVHGMAFLTQNTK